MQLQHTYVSHIPQKPEAWAGQWVSTETCVHGSFLLRGETLYARTLDCTAGNRMLGLPQVIQSNVDLPYHECGHTVPEEHRSHALGNMPNGPCISCPPESSYSLSHWSKTQRCLQLFLPHA